VPVNSKPGHVLIPRLYKAATLVGSIVERHHGAVGTTDVPSLVVALRAAGPIEVQSRVLRAALTPKGS